MAEVGQRLRAHGVIRIYLVHGTFVGTDAIGVLASLRALFPSMTAKVRRFVKDMIDAVSHDVANYPADYARRLEAALNAGRDGNGTPGQPIEVRRFHWSSENNHIGRAEAAVALVEELCRFAEQAAPSRAAGEPPARVMLWGHSHAGNVFALATNLLGSDLQTRERFFSAARSAYEWPLVGIVDGEIWKRVRQRLDAESRELDQLALDIVTFGTPIRYGWETGGYARLLHFVYHVPLADRPVYLTSFPPSIDEVQTAANGDYVQQIGIAGTNIPPNVFSWRRLTADCRLGRLLQPQIRQRDLLANLQRGMRVPADGTTLLVDYGPPGVPVWEHFAGHAVYTRIDTMLFHVEQTAKWLTDNIEDRTACSSRS